MATGFVYFLNSRGTDQYKIGLTNNLDRRLKELNSGQAPFPVDLLWSIPVNDTHAAEGELHQYFKEYRGHGEWFEFQAGMVVEHGEVYQQYQAMMTKYPNTPVQRPREQPTATEWHSPQSYYPQRSQPVEGQGILMTIAAILLGLWIWPSITADYEPLATAETSWAMPKAPKIPGIPKVSIPKMTLPKMPWDNQPKQVTVTKLANIRATPNGTKLRTADKGTVLTVTTIDPNGWWAIQGGGFVHKSMVK